MFKNAQVVKYVFNLSFKRMSYDTRLSYGSFGSVTHSKKKAILNKHFSRHKKNKNKINKKIKITHTGKRKQVCPSFSLLMNNERDRKLIAVFSASRSE